MTGARPEAAGRLVTMRQAQAATRLLRTGAMSLAEIALATGFTDQSHFTRRFRVHTGVTPGQVRERRSGR